MEARYHVEWLLDGADEFTRDGVDFMHIADAEVYAVRKAFTKRGEVLMWRVVMPDGYVVIDAQRVA